MGRLPVISGSAWQRVRKTPRTLCCCCCCQLIDSNIIIHQHFSQKFCKEKDSPDIKTKEASWLAMSINLITVKLGLLV